MLRTLLSRVRSIVEEHGIKEVFRRAVARLKDTLLGRVPPPHDLSWSIRILDWHRIREEGCLDSVETAFRFTGVGRFTRIEPLQDRRELVRFARFLRSMSPESLLEIGTARGGLLYVLVRCVGSLERVISVDLPGGEFGGGYTKGHEQFFRSFCEDVQLECIRKSSRDPETLEAVRRTARSSPLDVVIIDGDHTYSGVSADFELYYPLVGEGGVVAIHDINPDPRYPDIEVPRFWEEIKEEYGSEEIVECEQGAGYGLIRKAEPCDVAGR